MNNNDRNDQNKSEPPRSSRKILTIILIAVLVTLVLRMLTAGLSGTAAQEISYTEFEQMIQKGEVESVLFQNDRIIITPKDAEKPEKQATPSLFSPGSALMQTRQETKRYFTGIIPNLPLTQLKAQLDDAGIEYESAVQEETSLLLSIISWLLPVAAMYLLFTLLMNVMSKRMGGGGGLGSIGKNKAKVYMEKQTGVTFADVAGQDEAKESLVEIIDFLHNPQKYAEIGAKLPKGALLIGSPGTGKTLLAKAVAGEANVPFFSISGSDFVEMFVGVGASRVRDLFNEASKVAPSIIFIDEIDAIGRTRDSKFGGNDEREQTLNQLLAEIDGFDSSKGVVILAATNRPEILDKALLRAGRFDRRIIVDRPNLAGRYQTLRVHTKNIKLADDVDLNKIAQATAGAVGADLASLVNEAALRAVRKGRKMVNQEDLMTSFEFVIAGTEKKGTILTDMEKRIVAYHEVGHALVAALEKHAQPVSKITIVPHTSGALGYTMQMPEEEKFLSTREELITELKTLLGGRAAEQTVFGVQTTGAANDIDRATELARKMITQYGMSDRFGLMALSTVSNPYLDGSTMMNCADETAAQADSEIKALLENCYEEAKRILTEKRTLLDEIALYLLEKETIVGEELMSFIRADQKRLTAAEDEADEASAEQTTDAAEEGQKD